MDVLISEYAVDTYVEPVAVDAWLFKRFELLIARFVLNKKFLRKPKLDGRLAMLTRPSCASALAAVIKVLCKRLPIFAFNELDFTFLFASISVCLGGERLKVIT